MSLGGGGNSLNSEINVTPLVDVMLVLLVVFMVTAPMLNAAEVDLPEIETTIVEDPAGPVTVTITKRATLQFEGKDVKWGDLRTEFANSERLQEKKELFIAADKTLPYGYVVTAMAIANKAGISKVKLQTDAATQFDVGKLDVPGALTPGAPGTTPTNKPTVTPKKGSGK